MRSRALRGRTMRTTRRPEEGCTPDSPCTTGHCLSPHRSNAPVNTAVMATNDSADSHRWPSMISQGEGCATCLASPPNYPQTGTLAKPQTTPSRNRVITINGRWGGCRLGGRCIRLISTRTLSPALADSTGMNVCTGEHKTQGGRRNRGGSALASLRGEGRERERERRRRGASTEMRNEERRCAAASSRWGGHDERPSPPVARARETEAVRREVRSSVAP